MQAPDIDVIVSCACPATRDYVAHDIAEYLAANHTPNVTISGYAPGGGSYDLRSLREIALAANPGFDASPVNIILDEG